MYCKHCEEKLPSYTRTHSCRKKGLLNVDEDSSFLVSSLIGLATGSALLGGLLGGDLLGGIFGDVIDDGDLDFF